MELTDIEQANYDKLESPQDNKVARGIMSGHVFAEDGFGMVANLTTGTYVEADSISEADGIRFEQGQKPTASRLNLTIEFQATDLTPRLSAQDFAKRIEAAFAAEYGTADTTVQLHSAFLRHAAAYQVERDAYEQAQRDGRN